MSEQQRRLVLEQCIRYEVGQGGRVEAVTDHTAVIRYGKPTNHVLHLLLSVFSLGLWLCVWLVVALVGAAGRKAFFIDVDASGVAHRVPLPAG